MPPNLCKTCKKNRHKNKKRKGIYHTIKHIQRRARKKGAQAPATVSNTALKAAIHSFYSGVTTKSLTKEDEHFRNDSLTLVSPKFRVHGQIPCATPFTPETRRRGNEDQAIQVKRFHRKQVHLDACPSSPSPGCVVCLIFNILPFLVGKWNNNYLCKGIGVLYSQPFPHP